MLITWQQNPVKLFHESSQSPGSRLRRRHGNCRWFFSNGQSGNSSGGKSSGKIQSKSTLPPIMIGKWKIGVSPIGSIPCKYSHFPLNYDSGRKSKWTCFYSWHGQGRTSPCQLMSISYCHCLTWKRVEIQWILVTSSQVCMMMAKTLHRGNPLKEIPAKHWVCQCCSFSWCYVRRKTPKNPWNNTSIIGKDKAVESFNLTIPKASRCFTGHKLGISYPIYCWCISTPTPNAWCSARLNTSLTLQCQNKG